MIAEINPHGLAVERDEDFGRFTIAVGRTPIAIHIDEESIAAVRDRRS